MKNVKIFIKPGIVKREATGLFTSVLMTQFPDLPIEEETGLGNNVKRKNFIERIFAYHRLRELYSRPFSRRTMIDFHNAQKYTLMAHNPGYYRRLEQLVVDIKNYKSSHFRKEYRELFMQAMKFRATVYKNAQVLNRIVRRIKKHITDSENTAIIEAIRSYQCSAVPLIVPINLLRNFIYRYNIEFAQNQYYLNPHPMELMLRNQV
jgi:uncharacterized protein YbgA (DUF1722 family)